MLQPRDYKLLLVSLFYYVFVISLATVDYMQRKYNSCYSFFFQNWFQLSSVDNCEFSLPFDVLTDICFLQQSDFFQAQ